MSLYSNKLNHATLPAPNRADTDEISLVDIWIVLVRRRLVVATIALVSVALGVVYVLVIPDSYAYSTIIEIGTKNDRLDLIESVETVRAKIVDGYIPKVLREHLKKNPRDETRYEIAAEVPNNSQVVILRSTGVAELEPVYTVLQGAVVDLLRVDHERMLGGLREGLRIRLQMYKAILAELRRQGQVFEAKLEQLEAKQDFLAIASLRLAQTEVAAHIKNTQLQLAGMRETRAVVPPMRSLDPVGPGRMASLILSGLIGLFLGIIAAFFVDFAAKIRQQAAQQTQAT